MYMTFLREHLRCNHYSWLNEGNYTGDPSRRRFNPSDGNQILFIINSCATLVEEFTLNDGQKIEEMIYQKLPIGIKSEISVFKWLKENT